MICWEPKAPRIRKMLFGLVFTLFLFLMSLTQNAHAVPNGGYAHPEVIIQPEELKVLVEKKASNIRIIDVREKLQYLTGHIPGAVQVWRPDIEDKSCPLPGMMASQPQMEALLGNLGISEKNTLIIYSDLYDHARLWWILAYYGFSLKQIKLLDGGVDAWKGKSYPVELIPAQVEETRFHFSAETRGRKPLLCALPEVKSALKKPDQVILDVRTKKEYEGEEIKKGATRSGRIPGVTWIEWKETVLEEGPYKGRWKPAADIKKIFLAKGVTPEKDIYLY